VDTVTFYNQKSSLRTYKKKSWGFNWESKVVSNGINNSIKHKHGNFLLISLLPSPAGSTWSSLGQWKWKLGIITQEQKVYEMT